MKLQSGIHGSIANNLAISVASRVVYETNRRKAENARMIRIFTSIAVLDLKTPLSIAMPFSVKTYGRYFTFDPRPSFKVPNWHLEHSSFESWNMKSAGKRSILRFTWRLSCLTSTPYKTAKSRSSMTCTSRTTRKGRNSLRPQLPPSAMQATRHSFTNA